jgi:hypothetical protein
VTSIAEFDEYFADRRNCARLPRLRTIAPANGKIIGLGETVGKDKGAFSTAFAVQRTPQAKPPGGGGGPPVSLVISNLQGSTVPSTMVPVALSNDM